MELDEVRSILRRMRAAVVVVVVLAIVAGIFTAYRVSPSGLESRAFQTGEGSAQVLVDSPQSAIGDLRQDTTPLAARAGVLAQFMASTDVRGVIARKLGIRPEQLVTVGPFPGSTGGTVPPPSAARGSQVLGEKAAYRLDFSTQADLPLVTVVSRAPTPALAARLADAAVSGLSEYVADLASRQDVKPERRVVIRGLGPAQAQPVTSGPGKATSALAALAVLILGLLALVLVGRRRRGREPEAEYLDDFDDAAADAAVLLPSEWELPADRLVS
jgi:hypothetical protein